MNAEVRHSKAKVISIIIVLIILFLICSLFYGCKSSNKEELHIIVYTGNYSTNEYTVRNDRIITDKTKISSVLDYINKIKDECHSTKPSKVLSKMMHLIYKGKTMVLYSQGHDKFYLYEKASNKYFYLGEYYERNNYYAPFRKIIFDAANIEN